LSESQTVYCSFRGYNGLGKRASEMLKLVAEKHPEKLIVDLR
jgi:hypothetical protein